MVKTFKSFLLEFWIVCHIIVNYTYAACNIYYYNYVNLFSRYFTVLAKLLFSSRFIHFHNSIYLLLERVTKNVHLSDKEKLKWCISSMHGAIHCISLGHNILECPILLSFKHFPCLAMSMNFNIHYFKVIMYSQYHKNSYCCFF